MMMRTPTVARVALLLALVALVALGAWRLAAAPPGSPSPQPLSPASASTGFARAGAGRPLAYPTDYGPHEDFQTEWWYYTGNLFTADGRHFGYQLTFFRRALAPVAARRARPSAWATDQVYMAHFALTNTGERRFRSFERFSRGAAGLAGAQAAPYHVWLENWSVEETAPGMRRLRATQDELVLDLLLTDRKGPILQGEQGYSAKGIDPGNASYYYSLTQLHSAGIVQTGRAIFNVSGLSWMDHEWSTSALAPDQVGWDWFSLQLNDGSELMLFHLRKADGTIDAFSSGMYMAPDGATRRLRREDFTISTTASWRSPRSGAVYPARWTIRIPSESIALTAEPHLADQELNISFTYWEGAVRVSGQSGGNPISGDGYIELTGYAASMQGQF